MAEDDFADRYQILQEIGHGGTSVVYLAKDKKIQRIRAIKKIKKQKIMHMVTGNKEAVMLKALQHPDVVELYDILEDEEAIYFIMEYIEGRTLKEWMAADPQRTREMAITWGIQLCEVLQYLHSRNPPVIYRDLKPSNIMVRKNGRIVLIDFGASCRYLQKDVLPWGTPGYAAPEQLREEAVVDTRTDIYSLGVLLYEMAGGAKKDKKKHEGNARGRHVEEDTVLREIIRKCTKKEPEKRYQSTDEVKQMLLRYPYLRQKKKKVWKCAVVLDILLFLLAGVCFVFAVLLREETVRLREEGYSRYVDAGMRSDTRAYRIESLQNAIFLAPEKAQTYRLLLEELRSQGFDGDAYRRMMNILNSTEESGMRYEAYLQEQQEEYQTFCYEMAVACYFEWEEGSNKRYALPWLTIAKEGEYLTEEERTLMRALAYITQNYDYALADQEKWIMNYREYWEVLNELAAICDHAGAEKLAKGEALGQMLMHLPEFRTAGITKEEVIRLMNEIRTAHNFSEEVLQQAEELIDLVYEESQRTAQ